MNLLNLVAKLVLDSTEYNKGLDDSEAKASSFGDKLKSAFGVGAKAVGIVTAATTAMTGALVKGAGSTAAYGDNIDKMSQKMGLSAEAYQEWDAILQHSGTSIDSLSRGMTTLSKAAESGKDSFERLGISQEEIANMNQEQLFARTIEGLQKMEAGTERTALAQELLGGSARELGALLNTSAEDTEAMRQRVHELGGVMSDEAVKSAAAYQDSLQDMQTAFSGLSRGLLSEFMPSLTTVMDGLTGIFSNDREGGVKTITEGISNLVSNISSEVPKFLTVGSDIVLAITSAISDNLPTLFDAGVGAIMQIGTGLITQLPQMAKAGLQVIASLAKGISENLPELIPTVVSVVLEIVDILTEPDTLSSLLEASVAIIIALAEGLIDSLPKLLEKAPEIVMNLVSALIQNAPKLLDASVKLMGKLIEGIVGMFGEIGNVGKQIIDEIKQGFMKKVEEAKQWGKDLIQNFIDGITAKWKALKDKVSGVAGTVKKFLGFSEPEEGPLSDFHTYAPDMMELFAKGIRDNAGIVENELNRALDFDVKTKAPTQSYAGAGGEDIDGWISVIISAMREALAGVGIYLDTRKVGEIVAKSNENLAMAWR